MASFECALLTVLGVILLAAVGTAIVALAAGAALGAPAAQRAIPFLMLALTAAGLVVAANWAATRALAARARVGGEAPPPPPGGEAPPLVPVDGGDLLTPAEVAAVKTVRGRRLTLAELPRDTADVPRLTYRQRVYGADRRTTRHLGQRKLLLSEVEFLIDNARDGDTVVYVGSAPGIHIPFLASLFPEVRFVLYDPREFVLRDEYPGALARITAHQQFFTDEDAKRYAGRDDVLFVSDVRTGTDGPEIPSDDTVEADMTMQAEWVRLMNPRAVLLKYRLNYTKDKAMYLAGHVRLQVWPGARSTETRLEAHRPYRWVEVSARDHEERMFFVNTILREWAAYDHGVPVALVRGLDHSFDAASEVRIWRRYLEARHRPATASAVAKLMNAASAANKRGLGPALNAPGRHRWAPPKLKGRTPLYSSS
jgi:hypothetical protein